PRSATRNSCNAALSATASNALVLVLFHVKPICAEARGTSGRRAWTIGWSRNASAANEAWSTEEHVGPQIIPLPLVSRPGKRASFAQDYPFRVSQENTFSSQVFY